MSYTDVMTRIGQIDSQLSGLQTAFVLPSTSSAASSATTATPTQASATFSSALTSAINGSSASGVVSAPGATAALPATAGSLLTSGQQQFVSQLASDTGLDPGVVSAWVLSEESGGAASSRQSANNNDWLNIGYTDSGTYGAADSVWSDPTAAANATAGWLQGQNTIPGYGTASSGIQAIVATAGQAPQAQISALQTSGWASSGYPDLPSLYQQVVG
jgi:hypothetical protein